MKTGDFSWDRPLEITIKVNYRKNRKGKRMKYKVHRLEVKEDSVEEKLERFLNQLEGEVLSVIPYTTPKMQGMGATSKVKFLLIVEKTN